MPTREPYRVAVPHLPAGYRVERRLGNREGTIVYYDLYKDGYVWKNDEPRSYFSVDLRYPREAFGEEDFTISCPSSSDKSLDLARCIYELLALALRETQEGPPHDESCPPVGDEGAECSCGAYGDRATHQQLLAD